MPMSAEEPAFPDEPAIAAARKDKPMTEPWIGWISEQEAEGELRAAYEKWLAANPEREKVPDILKCFSQRPDILKAVLAVTYPLQFADGHLDRQTKEAIATYVSGLNQCDY